MKPGDRLYTEAEMQALREQWETQRDLLRRIYENERVWRVIPNSIAADLVAEVEGSSPAKERS